MKLYKTLLGDNWNKLDPLLRSYLDTERISVEGEFTISNGRGGFSDFIARILQLPRSAEKAFVKLNVSPCAEGEVWERFFPDRHLTSIQSVSSDGYLVEDFGFVLFGFRLLSNNGGITFDHRYTMLRIFGLNLRLPRFISPTITAREEGANSKNSNRVFVSLRLPLVGNVLSYGGIVTTTGDHS